MIKHKERQAKAISTLSRRWRNRSTASNMTKVWTRWWTTRRAVLRSTIIKNRYSTTEADSARRGSQHRVSRIMTGMEIKEKGSTRSNFRISNWIKWVNFSNTCTNKQSYRVKRTKWTESPHFFWQTIQPWLQAEPMPLIPQAWEYQRSYRQDRSSQWHAART